MLNMSFVPQAIGEVAGAIRTSVDLTRHSRLRSQIRDTLALLAAAKEHPELEDARSDLVRVIILQSAQLWAELDPSRLGDRDWSGAIVGLVLTAGVGLFMWAMWQPWGLRAHWWGWLLLAVVALLGILFLFASLGLMRRQPRKAGVSS
jgi:hypothetical protein